MTGVLLTLAVVAVIVLTGISGYRNGVFFTTYALVRNLFCFICAMTFAEPLAGLILSLGMMDVTDVARAYLVFICYALVFFVVFAVGRLLKVHFTVPEVICPRLADQLAGPVVGVAAALVATGAVLVGLSLAPFNKFIPRNLGRMRVTTPALDTGKVMLHIYDYVQARMGGSRPFLLHDEAMVEDLNHNDRPDLPGEAYENVLDNGQRDRGWLWRYEHYELIGVGDLEAVIGEVKAE